MRYSLIASLVAVASISACGSSPSKHQPTATFVTHIADDGSKLFVFSLQPPQTGGSGAHGRGGGMHGGRHGGMSGGDQSAAAGKMQQGFDDMLQAKLADSGFCRNGYVEQDRTMGSGIISVRGECKDKATPEDRVHFKNTDD